MGGSGANGGGGADPTACYGVAGEPLAEGVEWQATAQRDERDDVVAITGLVHVDEQNALFAYGNTTNGLVDLDIPLVNSPQGAFFVVELNDARQPGLVLNGSECTSLDPPPSTRRITAYHPIEDEILVVGSIPGVEASLHPWSIGVEDETWCETPEQFLVESIDDEPTSNVPFAANTDAGTAFHSLAGESDGIFMDAAFDDSSKTFAYVGGLRGGLFGETVETSSFVVGAIDHQALEFPNYPIPELPMNTSAPQSSWSAGVAVDEDGKIWFGGGACPAPGGCADDQAFFGSLTLSDGEPQLLASAPGTPSAVTTVRYRDERVVLGGRYNGELAFLGATLPDAAETVPFVVTLDRAEAAVVWTYPKAGDEPMAVSGKWVGVVDMAVAGTKECGAIYVAGCIGDDHAACTSYTPGTTGFLLKLDLATGDELYREIIVLTNPATDVFAPTAIAASVNPTGSPIAQNVWLAATYNGAFDLWGERIASGVSRESVVVRLAP